MAWWERAGLVLGGHDIVTIGLEEGADHAKDAGVVVHDEYRRHQDAASCGAMT